MTWLKEIIDFAVFLWPALLVAGAIAISASVTGVFVLLRGEGMLALTLPELVAVGAALGLKMGWPTFAPSTAAVIAALCVIAWARHRGLEHTVLPSLYVGCMCLTILLIANAGEHLGELKDLIAGFDVAVSERGALCASPVLLAAGAVVGFLFRRWLLISQSPAVAQLAGLRPALWNTLFLCLLSTIVLVGASESGIAMVLSMLFLPAGTVLPWSKRILSAIFLSIAVAIAMLATGFVFSLKQDWPLSQSVGGVGFVMLALSCITRAAADFAQSRRTT